MPTFFVEGPYGSYNVTVPSGYSVSDIKREYTRISEDEERKKREIEESQTVFSAAVAGPIQSAAAGFHRSGEAAYSLAADALRTIGATDWAAGAEELASAAESEAMILSGKAERGGTPWLLRKGPETLAMASPYGLAASIEVPALALGAVGSLAFGQTYGLKGHEYKQEWLKSDEASQMLEELRRSNPNAEEADLMWAAQVNAMPAALGQATKTALLTVAGGKGGQMLAKRLGLGIVTGAESLPLLGGRGAGAVAPTAGIGRKAASVGLSSIVEAVEEASDAAVESAIDYYTWRPDITSEEVKDRIAESFLLGGLFGGGMSVAFEVDAGWKRSKKIDEMRAEIEGDRALIKPFVDRAYDRIMSDRIARQTERESVEDIPSDWRVRAKEAKVKASGPGRKKPQVWKETLKAEGKSMEKEISLLEAQLTEEFSSRAKELREVPEDTDIEDVSAFKEALESRGVPTRADAPFFAGGPVGTFNIEAALEAEVPSKPKRKRKPISKAAQELKAEAALEAQLKAGEEKSVMESIAEEKTKRTVPGKPVSVFEEVEPRTGEERPIPAGKVESGLSKLAEKAEKVRTRVRRANKEKISAAYMRKKPKGKASKPSYVPGKGYTSEGGFAMPIDAVSAAMAESILTGALKLLNKGMPVAKVIDSAYTKLSKETDVISKSDFQKWIMPRMYAAMLDIQSDPKRTENQAAASAIERIKPATVLDIAGELIAGDGIVTTKRKFTENPIKFLQLLYHGNARVLLDNDEEAIRTLGAAMQNSVDIQDIHFAKLMSILLPKVEKGAVQSYFLRQTDEEKVAADEFNAFMVAEQQHVMNKKSKKPRKGLDVDKFRIEGEELSPLAKNMIAGWKALAKYTGEYMENYRGPNGEKLKVKLPNGKLRNFQSIGELFGPRKLQDRFQFVIENSNLKSDDHIEFAKILREEGIIPKDTTDENLIPALKKVLDSGDFDHYLHFSDKHKVGSESPTRFIAMMEKARVAKKVPVKLLDLSFEGMVKYSAKWAERMAQIEAFGQPIANNNTDIFDVVIKAIEGSKRGLEDGTIRYLEAVQSMSYNPQAALTTAQKAMVGTSKLATPLMLSSGMAAIRNMTGMSVNFVLGRRHALKAFIQLNLERFAGGSLAKRFTPKSWLTGSEFLSVKSYAERIAATEEMGVLRKAMANLLGGHDLTPQNATQVGRSINESLEKFGEHALQYTAFTPAERYVRAHTAMTFDMFRVSALEARIKDGENAKMFKEFKAFVDRQGSLNIDGIIGEYDTTRTSNDPAIGPETQKYIIRAVKVAQGGYKLDQLPEYMKSPFGKFMMKFYPYGLQVATTMDINVYRPLKETVLAYDKGKATLSEVGSAGIPLLIAMAATTGSGELMYEVREWIFGKKRPHASIGEMMTQLMSGNADAAISSAWDRMVSSFIYAGTMGTVVDTLGTVRDFTNRQRAKDPLDPAPMNLFRQLVGYGLRGWESKEMLGENLDTFMRRTFSTYNYGQGLVLQGAKLAAPEWSASRLHQAKQDKYVLRRATERFARDMGVDLNKMLLPPEYLPTEKTPYYVEMEKALLIGDIDRALKGAIALAEAVDPEVRAKMAGRISQSIIQRQPLKVGRYSNKDIQNEFIAWARVNLTKEQQIQMFRVQTRYVSAALNAGLLGTSEPQLRRAIRRLINGVPDKTKSRRPRPAGPSRRRKESKEKAFEFRELGSPVDILSGKAEFVP